MHKKSELLRSFACQMISYDERKNLHAMLLASVRVDGLNDYNPFIINKLEALLTKRSMEKSVTDSLVKNRFLFAFQS